MLAASSIENALRVSVRTLRIKIKKNDSINVLVGKVLIK
jgi:hypothetical protein